MLTLFVAFSPLVLAYLEIALIRLALRPRGRRSTSVRADLARDHLSDALTSVGVVTEAHGEEGIAPIELVCRDSRPFVGGRMIVHARLPEGDREATSADVLMLADRVWRARGIRGLLVANGFSDQARTAARATGLSVELLGWGDLVGWGDLAAASPIRPAAADAANGAAPTAVS